MTALPSVFSLPLVGDTLSMLKDPGGFLLERARELGPVFKAKVLGDDVACFVGPDAFAHFLDTKLFTRANGSPPHVQQIMGHDAVLFLEGEAFRTRKELLMNVFSEAAIDAYAPLVTRVTRRYARRWAELGAFTWKPEIFSYALTVASALFLGTNPDVDDPALENDVDLMTRGILAIPVKLPGGAFARGLKARDRVLTRIERAIAEHEKTPQDDALSRAIAARTKTGEKLTKDQLLVETFHFFVAYVPVIGGLTMLAMELGLHPEVVRKIRDEAEEKLGDRPITWQNLRALTYLDAVCKESRRIQPVLPVTFFAVAKEDSTFQGFEIKRGMKAVGCIGATLLDDKVYPEPNRFEPERWMGARPTEKMQHAWVPHGGGQPFTHHRCAGEWLADLMLKTFALVMARDYTWSLPPQDLAPTKGELFAVPASGLDVRLKRRTADYSAARAED